MPLDLPIDYDELASICRRYRVAKLELFGSRARGEARPDSDVDALVTFEVGHTPGMFGPIGFMALLQDLERLFGHSVDLMTRPSIEQDENQFLREGILDQTEVLYAA